MQLNVKQAQNLSNSELIPNNFNNWVLYLFVYMVDRAIKFISNELKEKIDIENEVTTKATFSITLSGCQIFYLKNFFSSLLVSFCN